MLKNLKIEYSLSFAFLPAAMIICGYSEIILPFFSAALIHETGHIAAIYLLKGQVNSLDFNCGGLRIDYNSARFSYLQDVLCALSGPAFGIISAFIFSSLGFSVYSGICFSINIFNLLPVRPLDGGRILWSLCMQFFPYRAELLCRIIEIIFLSALLLAAIYLALKFGNFTLLYITAVLTICYCKER